MSDSDICFGEKIDLLLDAHRLFLGSQEDSPRISMKSLQCLVNLLINQSHRMKQFVESNGVTRLCLSLKQFSFDQYSGSLLVDLQYAVKVIFMIKSW